MKMKNCLRTRTRTMTTKREQLTLVVNNTGRINIKQQKIKTIQREMFKLYEFKRN